MEPQEHHLDDASFTICPPLPAKEFAEYCMERGLNVSEERLIRLTDLKLFYPVHENLYSTFQIYTLNRILGALRLPIDADLLCLNDYQKILEKYLEWARKIVPVWQEPHFYDAFIPIFCQAISNRYYPITQTDQRSFSYAKPSHFDWAKYCEKWDTEEIINKFSLTHKIITECHEHITISVLGVDPLAEWYNLVSFISLNKKKKLRGKALLAQALYSMEHMIRLFSEEAYGEKLPLPGENNHWKADNFYGEGIRQKPLEFLGYLVNEYHINPKPKLILVVEGQSEYYIIPKLVDKCWGIPLEILGIEIINLHGIGQFVGAKSAAPYGALERLIDDHHKRQTMVFILLDPEDQAKDIAGKLQQRTSLYGLNRKVTSGNLTALWERCFEFDNFSPDEISNAFNSLSDSAPFNPEEIEDCYNHKKNHGAALKNLYRDRTGNKLDKIKLTEILFGDFLSGLIPPQSKALPDKPIFKILEKIIKLAGENPQPISRDIAKHNQESGYLG